MRDGGRRRSRKIRAQFRRAPGVSPPNPNPDAHISLLRTPPCRVAQSGGHHSGGIYNAMVNVAVLHAFYPPHGFPPISSRAVGSRVTSLRPPFPPPHARMHAHTNTPHTPNGAGSSHCGSTAAAARAQWLGTAERWSVARSHSISIYYLLYNYYFSLRGVQVPAPHSLLVARSPCPAYPLTRPNAPIRPLRPPVVALRPERVGPGRPRGDLGAVRRQQGRSL